MKQLEGAQRVHISAKWILRGHVTLAMPLFGNFVRGHVQTVPGNMHIKFEVRPFNHEQLAINTKNFGGHVTIDKNPFWKLLRDHVWTDCLWEHARQTELTEASM